MEMEYAAHTACEKGMLTKGCIVERTLDTITGFRYQSGERRIFSLSLLLTCEFLQPLTYHASSIPLYLFFATPAARLHVATPTRLLRSIPPCLHVYTPPALQIPIPPRLHACNAPPDLHTFPSPRRYTNTPLSLNT